MTRREAALAAWQQVRDATPQAEMAYLRRNGYGPRYDAPPSTARAIEDDDEDARGRGVWEFYTVEQQPSDLPGYSRWLRRRVGAGFTDPHPGRVYLPLDATTEDAWRRFELRRYERLVRFDVMEGHKVGTT